MKQEAINAIQNVTEENIDNTEENGILGRGNGVVDTDIVDGMGNVGVWKDDIFGGDGDKPTADRVIEEESGDAKGKDYQSALVFVFVPYLKIIR